MRIIQLIQKPQARGAEIFTSWLSESLRNKGHHVLIVSLFEGNFELPFSGKHLQLNRKKKNRFWDLIGWRKFNKIVADFKPDIIQANGGDTVKFAAFYKKFFNENFKLIFNNGGLVSTYITTFGHQVFNQFLFKNVDGFVSVSNSTKNDLDQFLGGYKRHCLIPIAIQIPFFDRLAKPTPFPVLVQLAGFTKEKNHKGALQIFSLFQNKYSESQLWLIGDGPEKENIEKAVENLGFKDQVRFLGALPNPFDKIPENAMLILPSISEGLPAVLLEAFYARIPVFANAVGGIPEVIQDCVNGFLMDLGREDIFVTALVHYFQLDENSKKMLLDQAQKLVLEHYTIDRVAILYTEFYSELCGLSN